MHAGCEELKLSAFNLQLQERFTYEYDFYSHWHHVIRLERILPVSPTQALPVCIAGRGACPPEDSGPSEHFMRLLDERSVYDLIELLQEEVERADFVRDDMVELLEAWWPWIQDFDRKRVNLRLRNPTYSGSPDKLPEEVLLCASRSSCSSNPPGSNPQR